MSAGRNDADERAEETISELEERMEELCNSGDQKGTLECCDVILARDPKNVYPQQIKAEILEKRGDFEEAVKCHEATLKNDPNHELAVAGKIWCLLNRNKTKEACEFADAKLEENRDNLDVLIEMEYVLREMEQLERADRCYDAIAKIKPKHMIR